MAVDPGSAGALTKLLDALKSWPLWLLAGTALCLTALVAIPPFLAMVPPPFIGWAVFATVAAWILVLARTVSLVPDFLAARRATRNAATKFVVTPVHHESFWHIAKQPDGSYLTQFTIRCMVKNRMTEPLHLMKAKILRPRIRGQELPGVVLMQATGSNMYGTAHVSGFNIPPGLTLPASATLFIRGMPKQRSGALKVLFELTDADANSSRVAMLLNSAGQSAPPYEGFFSWVLKRLFK